jgi:hypothetical protein
MGYRGKVKEQEQARALRAEGHTLAEIAAELGVAKSSVSLWSATSHSNRRPGDMGPTVGRILRTRPSSDG